MTTRPPIPWRPHRILPFVAGLMLTALPVGAAAAADVGVAIVDFSFAPSAVEIEAGDTVTWTNQGEQPHTVTGDAGAPAGFDSETISPGGTFAFTFEQPGTYTYFCHFHHEMTGRVEVRAPGQPIAVDDALSLMSSLPEQRSSASVAVLANDSDPDGDALTVSSSTQGSSGGTVQCTSAGECTYTERSGSCTASDSFRYTITDGTSSDTAQVRVSIDCPDQSHGRSLSLSLRRHLVAKGRLSVVDGPSACVAEQRVILQKRKAGRWVKVAATTTDASGDYRKKLADAPGRYRAKARATSLERGDSCGRATATARHRH